MKIMVTGATGQLGSLVVEALLKSTPADNVAVSVRDPQKAKALSDRGVDVRFGDFNQPESLVTAFAGIDRLLIISTGDLENRLQQQLAAVKAAQQANVGFIAYTSASNAAESKFILANDHRITEEAIRETGIPYSMLRNNWYIENEIGSIQAVLNGAPWVTAIGPGKIGYASRGDFAEAAAIVLAGEGHDNTVYELAGKPSTQEEFVAIIADVTGRQVDVQQVNDETYASVMSNVGMPEAMIPFLVAIQGGLRDGGMDVESEDLPKLLGRETKPLKDVIQLIVSNIQQ
ncbi:SDR family oxidoreductase [Paenibacillus sp. OV219]|uniref:SDR family oxidoreductase n=1 Tax=Paenibacillus sp. OV219 TaxID=1884377 RepID=UPI0008C284C1|nr:SDR family oxidoreductase [Paenibacillus sp. OV219]SEO72820.1 NAD(P)H dehydrogenase (quinone) [Paenibacillus sp. OV219]